MILSKMPYYIRIKFGGGQGNKSMALRTNKRESKLSTNKKCMCVFWKWIMVGIKSPCSLCPFGYIKKNDVTLLFLKSKSSIYWKLHLLFILFILMMKKF